MNYKVQRTAATKKILVMINGEPYKENKFFA